jgi:hypothetical protein
VLWLLGFSINVLTLFGLVLRDRHRRSTTAIVVVENVERHIESGKTARAARAPGDERGLRTDRRHHRSCWPRSSCPSPSWAA